MRQIPNHLFNQLDGPFRVGPTTAPNMARIFGSFIAFMFTESWMVLIGGLYLSYLLREKQGKEKISFSALSYWLMGNYPPKLVFIPPASVVEIIG